MAHYAFTRAYTIRDMAPTAGISVRTLYSLCDGG